MKMKPTETTLDSLISETQKLSDDKTKTLRKSKIRYTKEDEERIVKNYTSSNLFKILDNYHVNRLQKLVDQVIIKLFGSKTVFKQKLALLVQDFSISIPFLPSGQINGLALEKLGFPTLWGEIDRVKTIQKFVMDRLLAVPIDPNVSKEKKGRVTWNESVVVHEIHSWTSENYSQKSDQAEQLQSEKCSSPLQSPTELSPIVPFKNTARVLKDTTNIPTEVKNPTLVKSSRIVRDISDDWSSSDIEEFEETCLENSKLEMEDTNLRKINMSDLFDSVLKSPGTGTLVDENLFDKAENNSGSDSEDIIDNSESLSVCKDLIALVKEVTIIDKPDNSKVLEDEDENDIILGTHMSDVNKAVEGHVEVENGGESRDCSHDVVEDTEETLKETENSEEINKVIEETGEMNEEMEEEKTENEENNVVIQETQEKENEENNVVIQETQENENDSSNVIQETEEMIADVVEERQENVEMEEDYEMKEPEYNEAGINGNEIEDEINEVGEQTRSIYEQEEEGDEGRNDYDKVFGEVVEFGKRSTGKVDAGKNVGDKISVSCFDCHLKDVQEVREKFSDGQIGVKLAGDLDTSIDLVENVFSDEDPLSTPRKQTPTGEKVSTSVNVGYEKFSEGRFDVILDTNDASESVVSENERYEQQDDMHMLETLTTPELRKCLLGSPSSISVESYSDEAVFLTRPKVSLSDEENVEPTEVESPRAKRKKSRSTVTETPRAGGKRVTRRNLFMTKLSSVNPRRSQRTPLSVKSQNSKSSAEQLVPNLPFINEPEPAKDDEDDDELFQPEANQFLKEFLELAGNE